jgi:hypothetical protein
MWNERLIACARAYPTGVLTIVEPSGYPLSVRCVVQFDAGPQVIVITDPPPGARAYQGLASLLFHRHNEHLENQYEMMIKGEVAAEGDRLVFRPGDFLTGTGSPTSDRMPHAGNPVQLIQFMRLGRRKAKEYIAKRGQPWPPVDFKAMLKAIEE